MWLDRNQTQAENGAQGAVQDSLLHAEYFDAYGMTRLESASWGCRSSSLLVLWMSSEKARLLLASALSSIKWKVVNKMISRPYQVKMSHNLCCFFCLLLTKWMGEPIRECLIACLYYRFPPLPRGSRSLMRQERHSASQQNSFFTGCCHNSPVGKTSQVVMIHPTLQVRKQFQRGYVIHPESDLDSQDVSARKYIRD